MLRGVELLPAAVCNKRADEAAPRQDAGVRLSRAAALRVTGCTANDGVDRACLRL